MSYSIKIDSSIPAIIGTWHDDFAFADEGKAFSNDIQAELETVSTPHYYIIDMSAIKMSFNDIMEGSNMGARGADANFHHDMNRGTILITSDSAVASAAAGLDSLSFGNAKVQVYSSLEDAINEIQTA